MKKIAVLTVTWSNDNFNALLKGLTEFTESNDFEFDIFNAYDICTNKRRSINELSIHLLPKPEQYEGLIIYTNTSAGDEILRQITASFKGLNKPIVGIDRKIEGIPYICIDNYNSEYEMMEHMITKHDCKTFQYVGGVKDFIDNTERYRAFRDCLENHGIACDERYVSFYKFLEQDGNQAYLDLKKKNLPMPDAVICANDKMAIGYCIEAYKDGKASPEDYLLCGFDNISEGQNHYPSITSVNKNIPHMIEKSLEYIRKYWDGIEIPEKTQLTGYMQINGSCGCNSNIDLKEIFAQFVQNEKIRKYTNYKYRELRMQLCASKTFRELQGSMKDCYKRLGLYEAALCIKKEIYESENELSSNCYSDEMICYTHDEVLEIDREISTRPAAWESRKEKIFVYSPLYFDTSILGYVIIPYQTGSYDKLYHENFIDSLSIAAENARQKILIENINQKFKKLYVADQMTGLHNRFGYSALSGKMFKKYNGRVFVVYVDIDNLKTMNDNFGHDLGDKAIIGAANCINKIFNDDTLKVRMGGDEFLIMGEFINEQMLLEQENALQTAMKDYTLENELPVPLEASIGHSFNTKKIESTELGRMMKTADDNMYKTKQRRKMQKKNSVH